MLQVMPSAVGRVCHHRLVAAIGGVVMLSVVASCDHRQPSRPESSDQATRNTSTASTTASQRADDWRFADVTQHASIDFRYRSGGELGLATVLETLGGGLAWFDLDQDGLLDLFFTGGGAFTPSREIQGFSSALYRQSLDGRFVEVRSLAGGFDSSRYTHGVAVSDYDHDGFPDILVTGYAGLQLWQNLGDGTFREISEPSGLTDPLWSTSAAWGDLNADGHLDLYVAHYLNWNWQTHHTCEGPSPQQPEACSPKEFEGQADMVFLNVGDGTFQAARDCGLRSDGKGLGVVIGDVDVDGDVDIYVGNDTTENFLYLNDGKGYFTETGGVAGVDVDEHGRMNGSMGVDLGDFNQDGRPDVWVTNYIRESFALYQNVSDGLFQHRSQPLGIAGIGGLNVGWGTGFSDFDGDGDEDLIATTGHVMLHQEPLRQLPIVLRNNAGRRFERLRFEAEGYLGQVHQGRGLAIADYDNDGDVDVAISHNNEPVRLLRNECVRNSRWLRVRLVGRSSNRDGVGATLTLKTRQSLQMRLVKGGGSYLSHSDTRPTWFVPSQDEVQSLEIQWPSGRTQILASVPLDQTLMVLEP